MSIRGVGTKPNAKSHMLGESIQSSNGGHLTSANHDSLRLWLYGYMGLNWRFKGSCWMAYFTECKGAIEKTREALDNVFFKSFSSNGSNSPFLRKEETKINHSTTLVFINAIQRRESEGREDNMWEEKKNK